MAFLHFCIFLALFSLQFTHFVEAECSCSGTRFVGEYCGTILNERNGGNCTADMYFCGKSNLVSTGVILKTCVQKGFECDKKLNGGK